MSAQVASRRARHSSCTLSDGECDTERKGQRLRAKEERDEGQRRDNSGRARTSCRPQPRGPDAGLGAEPVGGQSGGKRWNVHILSPGS